MKKILFILALVVSFTANAQWKKDNNVIYNDADVSAYTYNDQIFKRHVGFNPISYSNNQFELVFAKSLIPPFIFYNGYYKISAYLADQSSKDYVILKGKIVDITKKYIYIGISESYKLKSFFKKHVGAEIGKSVTHPRAKITVFSTYINTNILF